jgi:hypothetical protein
VLERKVVDLGVVELKASGGTSPSGPKIDAINLTVSDRLTSVRRLDGCDDVERFRRSVISVTENDVNVNRTVADGLHSLRLNYLAPFEVLLRLEVSPTLLLRRNYYPSGPTLISLSICSIYSPSDGVFSSSKSGHRNNRNSCCYHD